MPLFIDLGVIWIECIALVYIGALQGLGRGTAILVVRFVIQWLCLVPLSYIVVTQFSGSLTQLWMIIATLTICKAIIMRFIWKATVIK